MRGFGAGIAFAVLLLTGPVLAEPTAGLQKLRHLGAPRERKPWTWIAVLNGDADNERSMLRDLRKMERIYTDEHAQAVSRAVVLIDRAKGFTTEDGDWTGARVYEVMPDVDRKRYDSKMLADCGELNMCDPETLRHFVAGAIEAFPADHYLLTVSTHGAGWAVFLADDDAPGTKRGRARGTMLTLSEGLRGALRDVGRERIDVLAIDSCIMGQLDLAVACKDLTETLLISESKSSGSVFGRNLIEIALLTAKDDPRAAAYGTIEAIRYHFHRWGTPNERHNMTKSAIDCRRLDDLLQALDALVERLLQTAARDWPVYAQAIHHAEAYVPPDDLKNGRQARASYDLLDLLEVIRLNVPAFAAEAEYQRFLKAADACILATYAGTERQRSRGIAIYAPIRPGLVHPMYAQTPLAKVSAWPRFLDAIHRHQQMHAVRPRFDHVRLVDAQGQPASSLRPLAGCRAHATLTGANLLSLHFGIAVPREKEDVLLFQTTYTPAIGAERREGLTPEKARLILPRFGDGATPIAQSLGGLLFQWGGGGGAEPVYVSVDSVNEDTPTVTIQGRLRQPGDEKFEKVVVRFNRESWECVDTERHMFDDQGNAVGVSHFEPAEDAVFKPHLVAIGRDLKRHELELGETRWGKRPRLILGLVPPGEQILYFLAQTVSGLYGLARVPYRMEEDASLQRFAEGKVRVDPAWIHGDWRLEAAVDDAGPGQATWRDTGVRLKFVEQEREQEQEQEQDWPNLSCEQSRGGERRRRDAHFETEGLPTLSLYGSGREGRPMREEIFVALPQQGGSRRTFLLRDLAQSQVLRLVPATVPPTGEVAELAGTWVSDEGVTLVLTSTRYRLLENGKPTDAGTYRVDGPRLVVSSDAGGVEFVKYVLNGDSLRLTDADGTVYALRRSKQPRDS